MDRRDFLRISGLAHRGRSSLPGAISEAFADTAPSENWKIFEVTHACRGREALRRDPRLAAHAARLGHALPEDARQPNTRPRAARCGIATDWATGTRIVWAEWPAGVAPVLVHTQHFATRDIAVDLLEARLHARREPGDARALHRRPRSTCPPTGIVKEMSDGHREGRGHRHREGARDLRVDLRQHVSRSQDARLRQGRHQLHAREQGLGRQVRRPQRALRGLRARRRASRRATCTAFASPARKLGYKSLGKAAATSPRRSIAARSSTAPGLRLDPRRSGRRAQGDPRGRRRQEARRSDGARRAQAPLRLVGDELARATTPATTSCCRAPRRARCRSSCIRRPRRRTRASTRSTPTTSSTRSRSKEIA